VKTSNLTLNYLYSSVHCLNTPLSNQSFNNGFTAYRTERTTPNHRRQKLIAYAVTVNRERQVLSAPQYAVLFHTTARQTQKCQQSVRTPGAAIFCRRQVSG
jgi:hypothetical protein